MLSAVINGEFSFVDMVIYAISCFVVIFLTLPIHEFAHGYAATKLGDWTPRAQGRLTLNPFAHIDYMGSLCILLFGFGWAKPVQVNARNFKNPKMGMAVTAFAGPLSNVIFALAALIFANICLLIQSSSQIIWYVLYFFIYIAKINVSLAVFNLIPIPPLDGSRLLSAFLPDRHYYKLMRYERYFSIIIFALIWSGALDVPLSFLSNAIISFISTLAELPFTFFN